MVLICIFLKSCTTIKKLYNHRKKLYIFGTLSLVLNFNVNGVCTKMYSFPKLCKSVVLIRIFLKSCTAIEKLCNEREKLYIFGTLLLALNFIDNGVCNKMYSFSKAVQILWSSYVYFQKGVQPLKSCKTKEKSCTSLVHSPWLLISLTMVFVAKCTVFSKAVQILWSSYGYF